jgi:hypothetical protein
MATTVSAPPVTPRRQSPLLCLTVAAAVVVACVVVDRVVIYHLVPRLEGHWPSGLLTELQLLVTIAPYAVFALALALWGISARHRLTGAACALLAGLCAWGIPYAYQKVFYEHDHITQTNLRVFDWTLTLAIPTLIAVAWGLARRSGGAWLMGLLVAPALAWADHRLELHSQRWQTWHFAHSNWWLDRLEFLAPAVIAAVVCSALDRRTPDMRVPGLGSHDAH